VLAKLSQLLKKVRLKTQPNPKRVRRANQTVATKAIEIAIASRMLKLQMQLKSLQLLLIAKTAIAMTMMAMVTVRTVVVDVVVDAAAASHMVKVLTVKRLSKMRILTMKNLTNRILKMVNHSQALAVVAVSVAVQVAMTFHLMIHQTQLFEFAMTQLLFADQLVWKPKSNAAVKVAMQGVVAHRF
jgi:hypothetical protein